MKNLGKNCSVKSEILASLETDKIKINWNKNPIQMNLFKSFVTVPLIESLNHLGSDNGWTMYKNDELKLEIGGGIVNGVEYLDRILIGYRTQNQFVNPFGIFHILTDEGKQFFYEYYEADLKQLYDNQMNKVEFIKNNLSEAENKLMAIKNIIDCQAKFLD